jgi:hypothetical protein
MAISSQYMPLSSTDHRDPGKDFGLLVSAILSRGPLGGRHVGWIFSNSTKILLSGNQNFLEMSDVGYHYPKSQQAGQCRAAFAVT